jgi:CHAT domain
MFEVYTDFFNYLSTHSITIRSQLGENAADFAKMLRPQNVIVKLDTGDLDQLGTAYENYLRKLIRYGLKTPKLEVYFSEFFEGRGLLRQTARGLQVNLTPKPTRVRITSDLAEQIRGCLRASSELADNLSNELVVDIKDPLTGVVITDDESSRPDSDKSTWKRAKPPVREPPLPAPPEAGEEPTEIIPSAGRRIVVTGHDSAGTQVKNFEDRTSYSLRFRVGSPVSGNLAVGNIGIGDLPVGGLDTQWVATSIGIEILSVAKGKAEQHGNVWRALFDLHIPQSGESETIEISVRPLQSPRSLNVIVYDVRGSAKQIYREFVVDLESQIAVASDSECVAPRHLHVRTTHEWTTPREQIQVGIVNGTVSVTTKRGPNNYSAIEIWSGTDNRIAGPIQNVRVAMEKFRENWDSYLNAIDPADMADRLLRREEWKPYSHSVNGMPVVASPQPLAEFDRVKMSLELRNLASAGYSLFDACFPQGSDIRSIVEGLFPGSRIDFFWTQFSGAGWVSHVPWSLMYMDPPDPLGEQPIDCERFFGLRFRIQHQSRSQKTSSLALGSPDAVHAMHLLYWGDNPADAVGVESRWQGKEFRTWSQQYFVPDRVQPDAKRQVIRALDMPAPPPVALMYFYCHCSVGDGSQPVLRFGNTSQAQDTLRDSELSQKNLSDAPLVFANACTTAASDPHLTNLLEDAFFRRGVRAFIGTETKVPIQLASRFAWLFFQFFFRKVDADPMAAGEALTQARMFLWTQYRNIGGLFYSLVNQYDLYLASGEEVERLT